MLIITVHAFFNTDNFSFLTTWNFCSRWSRSSLCCLSCGLLRVKFAMIWELMSFNLVTPFWNHKILSCWLLAFQQYYPSSIEYTSTERRCLWPYFVMSVPLLGPSVGITFGSKNTFYVTTFQFFSVWTTALSVRSTAFLRRPNVVRNLSTYCTNSSKNQSWKIW